LALDVVFFYAFAAMVVGGGALTILARSAVHSAIWLIVSLLGTAGLFLLQRAEFLFAVQIVLYIGGIMVLFLFVIMLVNLDQAAREKQFSGQWWLALAVAGCLAGELLLAARYGLPQIVPAAGAAAGPGGNTERLADLLFSVYLVPFEAASMLLLAAIVGGVLMARIPRPGGVK
jgi:NADH-quinone oxidoreductase subunit J